MCILLFFLILRDFVGNKYFLSSIILLGGNYLFFLFRIEYYPRFLTNILLISLVRKLTITRKYSWNLTGGIIRRSILNFKGGKFRMHRMVNNKNKKKRKKGRKRREEG